MAFSFTACPPGDDDNEDPTYEVPDNVLGNVEFDQGNATDKEAYDLAAEIAKAYTAYTDKAFVSYVSKVTAVKGAEAETGFTFNSATKKYELTVKVGAKSAAITTMFDDIKSDIDKCKCEATYGSKAHLNYGQDCECVYPECETNPCTVKADAQYQPWVEADYALKDLIVDIQGDISIKDAEGNVTSDEAAVMAAQLALVKSVYDGYSEALGEKTKFLDNIEKIIITDQGTVCSVDEDEGTLYVGNTTRAALIRNALIPVISQLQLDNGIKLAADKKLNPVQELFTIVRDRLAFDVREFKESFSPFV